MPGLNSLPGVLANQPDVSARFKAFENSKLAIYAPILDDDPERPGDGQLWLHRTAAGVLTLRTMDSVSGTIKSVTLT